MLTAIFVIFILIVLNGIFSGTEMALVILRESQLNKLEKESKAGLTVAQLARDPNRFLATIQVGITLAGFLASAVAAIAISDPIGEFVENIFQPFAGIMSLLSLIVVTLIISYFSLVFGELVPKRIAMKQPERWALTTAPVLMFVNNISAPIVHFLSASTNAVVRLFGINPEENNGNISSQELRDMIISHQALTDDHRTILRGAFEVSERRIGKVAAPRNKIFWLRADMKCKEAIALLGATEFSRAPVSETEDLDGTIGAVHLRDLLSAPPTKAVKEVVRQIPFYPESSLVLPIMQTMQSERRNIAMVVNEYGSVSGMVTLEDLVEEIVGEIYDDYDESVDTIKTTKSGAIILPGSFPLYDLPEFNIMVEDGPYSTLAGFLLHHLGTIPENPGDQFEYDNHVFTITKLGRRRIEEVSVTSKESELSSESTESIEGE